MLYEIQIFDKRFNQWYLDYKTNDIKNAENYFDLIAQLYDSNNIRVITRFDI